MDKYLDRWARYLKKKAQTTRKGYLGYFNRFITSSELTPTALYDMYLGAQKADDPYDKRAVQRLVSDFMFEMVENGFKGGTAAKVGQGVTSFFYANEVDFKLRRDDIPSKAAVGSNIIRKTEIEEYYHSFGIFQRERNRAIMMLAKDSGLRLSDLVLFDVEDYRHADEHFDDDGRMFKIFGDVITKKTGNIAVPVCGPETIQALDKYLGSRETGPLFISKYGGAGTRASSAQISNLFARMRPKIERNGAKITAHSLRKFNQTWLEHGGMPLNWIKKVQGRKIMDSTSAYSRPEETGELIKAYMKAYPSLEVFSKDTERERKRDKELEELKKKVSSLERQSVWNQPKMVTGIDTEAGRVLNQFFRSNGYDFLYRPQELLDQSAAEFGVWNVIVPFMVVDAEGDEISEEENDKLTKKFKRIYKVDIEDYLEKVMPVAGFLEQVLQEEEAK